MNQDNKDKIYIVYLSKLESLDDIAMATQDFSKAIDFREIMNEITNKNEFYFMDTIELE